MKRLTACLTALPLIWLAGCSTERADAVTHSCGTLYTYPPEFQKKLAEQLIELRKDPKFKETNIWADDYGGTRESLRNCIKNEVIELAP